MWTEYKENFLSNHCRVFINNDSKLKVIRSLSTLKNESTWIHVSVSKKIGQISWKDLMSTKNQFIGQNKEAIQVFPKIQNLIDIADCYHLWHHLSGEFIIPDLNDLIDEKPF